MDKKSPRVLKARGPRMQQASRAKRALKPIQPRVNQPVRLDQPIALLMQMNFGVCVKGSG